MLANPTTINFHLLCSWLILVIFSMISPSALAENSCEINGLVTTLRLDESENEDRCQIHTTKTISRVKGDPRPIRIDTAIAAEGAGPYEAHISVAIERFEIHSMDTDEFLSMPPEDFQAYPFKLKLGDQELSESGMPWEFKKRLPVQSYYNRFNIDIALAPLYYGGWVEPERIEYEVSFVINLSIRRIREGCWADGFVKGKHLYGDNAFWSDNPTGLVGGMDNFNVLSAPEAQQQLDTIGNMDIDALVKMGLDPEQLKAAKAAAGQVEVQNSDISESTAGLAEEMAQFAGHSFLTLQSVENEDDVPLAGGPSAGIAGDLSLLDLARGIGHILSQFSMTLELDTVIDPNALEEMWGESPTILHAGLVHEGLKYTHPRDGGETPAVLFGPCSGEKGPKANGALCGQVDWPDVAKVNFRAGHGAFSCINN